MATDEEVYRFLIQVENEEKLRTAAAAAALAEQKFKAMYSTLGAGAAQTKAAAAQLVNLNQEMKKLGSAAGKSSGATQGLTQLGYTLDDLQYGFKGIANNIQPLLSTVPQLAKIAPVIAIVATATYQLYEHWDQLAGLFGASRVKTQAEEMEELGKKTAKTADEAERLARAENLRSTTSTLQKGKTNDEKKADSAVVAAIDEAGFGTVIAGLQANAPALVNDQGEALKARENLEEFMFGGLGNKHKPGRGVVFNKSQDEPQVKAEKLRLEKELADARNLTAQGKIAQAANSGDWGSVPLDQLIAAVQKDPSRFGGKEKGQALLRSLKEATPESIKGAEADQQNRKFEAESARMQSAKRLASIQEDKDQEAYYDKQEKEIASRNAKIADDQRHREIQKNTAGFQEQFSPAILNNIARGQANDPKALAAKVSESLQKGGKSKEEAESIAADIAYDVLEKVAGRVRERSHQQGVSQEEGAAREAEEDTAAARSRAKKATGTTGSLESFAHNLQQSLFNKADPIQAAILAENRKIADRMEKLVEETRKVKPRQGQTAMAAGPA